MAEEKKTTVIVKPIAKAAVAKTEEKKVDAVKAAVAAKAEEKKAAAPAAAKKEAPAKKAAAPKKAAAKKAAAPKKAAAKKVATVKATASKVNVFIQFGEKSYSPADLEKIAKDVWVYDLGKKAADFKSAEIYVKPEENTAYYVINGTVTGSFGI